MSITVKLVNGSQKSVEVADFSVSVAELKKIVSPATEIPAEEQRIVLRGKVLKDDDILSAVGMGDGNTIHVVRSKKKDTQPDPDVSRNTSATDGAVSATASGNTSGGAQRMSENQAANNPYAALAGGMFNSQSQLQYGAPGTNMAGGNSGASPFFAPGASLSPQEAMQMMQNPMMMQFMQIAMQDPNFMQEVVRNFPQLANLPPAELQQMMDLMRNPQMMQQLMSLSNLSMMQNNNNGAQQQQPNQQNAAAPGGGLGFNPSVFAPPVPQGNPREIYREQLQQLRDMGFPNEDANIAALQQSQGSVSFAIERLFNA